MQVPEGVAGESEGAAVFGQCLLQGLAYPDAGPGKERRSSRGVETFQSAQYAEGDLLLKVVTCHAMTLVAARHRTQMRKRELHAASPGLAVAARRCGGESIDTRFVRDRGSHRPNDVADGGRQLTSAEYREV